MARKPMRECRVIGCHSLTRDGYCDKHISVKNERHKLYDEKARDRWAAKFYKSKAWKVARAKSLILHFGLCQDCLYQGKMTDAEMVHHIKPLREFPELATEQNNLKPLCNKCHGKY